MVTQASCLPCKTDIPVCFKQAECLFYQTGWKPVLPRPAKAGTINFETLDL